MPQTTLITAWEVVRYSPESNKFPTAQVEPLIFPKEQTVRRVLLGADFYDALVADMIDYGTVETWEVTGTYSSGEYVNYFGTTLLSLVSGNTTQPCDDPGNEYWQEAERFETGCYQSLWELYLRQYLAFTIMSDALPYATYQSGGKGLVEWMDDGGLRDGAGSKSASTAILTNRRNQLLQNANDIFQNMAAWMIAQNTAGTCNFSDALPVSCSVVNPSPPRRRIAYRRNGNY